MAQPSPTGLVVESLERVFKMLEPRLQAVASGEITVICRLKPGLQRLVTELEDTLLV